MVQAAGSPGKSGAPGWLGGCVEGLRTGSLLSDFHSFSLLYPSSVFSSFFVRHFPSFSLCSQSFHSMNSSFSEHPPLLPGLVFLVLLPGCGDSLVSLTIALLCSLISLSGSASSTLHSGELSLLFCTPQRAVSPSGFDLFPSSWF